MGRRSDHSREELEDMLVTAGHRHLAEVGFGGFSARHVAREVGYSVGTVYNVFPSLDHLLVAINTRTFEMWAEHLQTSLNTAGKDRIHALVEAYFSFAAANRNLWMAIYDHRLPTGVQMPATDAQRRAALTDLVVAEIARALGSTDAESARPLARSLIAVVHGHCAFALNGSFALMEEPDPLGQAVARVREAMAAA
jgi:AcrR family transcriptional regulator